MLTAADLLGMSRAGLEAIIAEGHPIDPDAIADKEYRGVSLGLPVLVEKLTWKTFKKAFHRDRNGLRGWNVRIEQTGLAPPFVTRQRRGVPWTFGHYAVEVRSTGLLLDYGRFAGRLDPLRFVRDPVVAVRQGDHDLLLGTTYLDLPTGRVATPSFFSLELDGPISHRPVLT